MADVQPVHAEFKDDIVAPFFAADIVVKAPYGADFNAVLEDIADLLVEDDRIAPDI